MIRFSYHIQVKLSGLYVIRLTSGTGVFWKSYIIVIIVGFIERKIDTNPLMCLSPRREKASETIYCLLRSDSLWQLVPFSWCGYCKATSAYVLLRED